MSEQQNLTIMRRQKDLKNKLFETAVRCETLADYYIVAGLYIKAGCNVWPWHKGFKEPSEDKHEAPFYGWEPEGFMKLRFPVTGDKLLTIPQLFNIVHGGAHQSHRKEAKKWVHGNVVLSENCDIEYSDLEDSLAKLLSEVAALGSAE